MKITEAIILAGGLGTRLRDTVPDLPKCMAPVAGRPFLFYVINHFLGQGIEKFIFSLGYKHEMIEKYLETRFSSLNYQISIEEKPLGTGGAAKLGCSLTKEKNVLLVNGDTLFKINLNKLVSFHLGHDAECTLSLKPLKNFDRYGSVELNPDYSINSFKEKQFYESGFINGGVYALDKEKFLEENVADVFSFEKDWLEKIINTEQDSPRKIYGVVQDEYFIDIGIPSDYEIANEELKRQALDLKSIDKSWTLFLDRDGVINKEKELEYVLNWNGFSFYNEVREAIKLLSDKFGKVVVVSNQRGVGKGLMTEDDLQEIHRQMTTEIEKTGGRIDKIYYSTDVNDIHPNRKPNPGMAFQAKNDFPAIDFSKSIMVGNKLSDMHFGRNTGMFTVYISTTNPNQELPHPDIDMAFPSLIEFARSL